LVSDDEQPARATMAIPTARRPTVIDLPVIGAVSRVDRDGS
jgi:hypothetical protein